MRMGFRGLDSIGARFRWTILTAAAVVTACVPLRAAVVPGINFEPMVAQAERVVHGRVIDSTTGSSGQYIWTHYRIEVLDTLKGSPLAQIVVSEPGGEWEGRRQELSGAVQFAPGEEVILFLYRTPVGYWRTLGYWQGKFEVTGPGAARSVHSNSVYSDLDTVPIVDSPGGPDALAPATTRLRNLNRMPVDEFKSLVRREIAGAETAGRGQETAR